MSVEVFVVDQFGDPQGEVVDAQVTDPTWDLNGPGTMTLGVPTDSRAARQIIVNRYEVQVHIDGEIWWGIPRRKRGDGKMLSFECEGLLSHFAHRYVLTSSLDYTSIDQLQIGWNLVSVAQTGTNRNRNITSAAFDPSGHNRSRRYSREEHPNILDLLMEFPTLDDGFDMDIVVFGDGRREWTPYYPKKGEARPKLALEWGRNVVGLQFNEDGVGQATLVYAVGGSANDVRFEARYEDVDTAAVYGSMESIVSAGDVRDVAWLADRARQDVLDHRMPLVLPELICSNHPVQLFGVVKTGDTLPVRVDYGGIYMVDTFRVTRVRWISSTQVGLSFEPELVELPPVDPETDVPPDSTADLTATAQSANLISLSWNATSDTTHYRIYRWNGAVFAFLFEINAPGQGDRISTHDGGLTPATLYRYKVSTKNAFGESALSAEASDTTL